MQDSSDVALAIDSLVGDLMISLNPPEFSATDNVNSTSSSEDYHDKYETLVEQYLSQKSVPRILDTAVAAVDINDSTFSQEAEALDACLFSDRNFYMEHCTALQSPGTGTMLQIEDALTKRLAVVTAAISAATTDLCEDGAAGMSVGPVGKW